MIYSRPQERHQPAVSGIVLYSKKIIFIVVPFSGSSTGGNADKDPSRARKISDAQTYGPRFSILYENYRSKFNLQIDTRRHLMSLCVEHMVNFVKWARESELQCSWISNILLENDYLRPEVRNGVVMVLIYTFASIKAVTANNANNSSRGPSSPVPDSNSSASSNIIDMFSTLQDHERGLGIANKFSLKIYNDPYNFLSFLKTSISALIDAGIIPDNERQNQPKRLTTQSNSAPASVASSVIPPAPTALSAGNIMNGNKLGYQNREELQAFTELSKMLIDLLDSGNNTGARRLVLHVTSFWQVKGKFVRNRRFVTALNALSQPIQTSSLELGEFDADEVIPAFATESELKIMRSTASSSARGTVIAGCNNTIFPTNNITQAQMMLLDHQNSDDASPPVSPPSIPSICNKRSISDLSSVDASGTGKTMSGANKKKDKERDLERESTPSTAPVVPTSSPQSLISTNTPVQSRSTTSNNDETLSSTLKPKNISSVSLQALRFERVGPYEWEIKETRVFDCQKFAKMLLCNINPGTSSTVWNSSTNCGHTHYRTIALIDEVALFAVMERDNKAVADSNSCKKFVARKDPNRGDNQFGLVSLEHELQVCGALVTSWPAGELSQFEATLSSWKTHADRLHHLFARHIHTLQAIQQQLRDRGENVIQVSDEDFGIDDSIIGAPISELTGVLDVSSCTPEEQTVYSRLQTIEGKMKSNSLYHFWKYHTPSPSPSVPFLPAGRSVGPIGYIGYEVDMTMVMLIRANEQLGMTEDIWCTLYPKELQDLQGHNNFQSFLSSLFPQISHLEVRMNRRKEKFSNDQRDEDIEITNNIMVKYFAHRLTSSSASESDSDTTALIPGIDTMMTRIPPPVAAQYYKTIGTFATPPGRVIAR